MGDQQKCGYGEDNCYSPEQRCDATWHCPINGGDERDCGMKNSYCFGKGVPPSMGDQRKCGYGEDNCYSPEQRFDATWHCPINGGDERDCGTKNLFFGAEGGGTPLFMTFQREGAR